MTHGSLFSGIGGFDLAAEWMGWDNLFHCEWNPFGQKVLHHYWPNAEQFTDITKSDFKKYANKIDILTGGFPCQPYSMAGKRLGKEDERHLWPEMLRVIKEIQPRWVVGENVFGLVNWSGGLVFHEVQADLEAAGYEVWPYVLPAAAVNAPHRRDRVWFVANSNSNGQDLSNSQHEEHPSEGRVNAQCYIEQMGKSNASNTKCFGWNEKWDDKRKLEKTQQTECREKQFSGTNRSQDWWRGFPSVSPICSRNDGLSNQLDGITFSKWRQESIKAAGNAIVPQVALQIFKAIQEYNETHR